MTNANRQRVWIEKAACAARLLVIGLLLSLPDAVVAQVTGTGTTGKVTKWTGSTSLGDSVITESANGSVGIGFANPITKLEVGGAIRATASQPAFYFYDTNGTTDARQFYFWNSGGSLVGRWVNDANSLVVAEGMTLRNNGNIGFGTTNPGYKMDLHGPAVSQFHITSNGTDSGLYLLSAGSDNAYLTAGASYNGAAWIAKSANAELFAQATGSFVFYSNTGLTAGNSFTPTERMRISSLGNVGIGTATPLARLHVGAGAAVPVTTGASLLVEDGTDTSMVIKSTLGGEMFFFQNNVGGVFGTASNHYLSLRTANQDRIRIDTSGNVGIGTISPSVKLDVVGNINASGTITGGNIIAKYQDVAEWVPARMSMPAGTVVVLDPEQSNHVMPAAHAYDTRVAGVISANPGVLLGEGGAGKVMVATTGRVRVKVDATSGPIRVGDLLVTSNREGIAMRSQPLDLGGTAIHRPGTLIGKALEPLEKGVGEILVLLSLQ